MKGLTLTIVLFLTLNSSHASAALKPLRGTLELACKQLRIKTSGERSTIYFRTIADMAKITTAVKKYEAGYPVSKNFQQLFDLSWSTAAKGIETECVQIKGDTDDDFSGRYLLRVVTMKHRKAKFFHDAATGNSLDDILFGSVK